MDSVKWVMLDGDVRMVHSLIVHNIMAIKQKSDSGLKTED